MQLNTRFTLAALASLALLGACSRNDEGRTAGQQVDGAVSRMEQGAERAKDATAGAADKVSAKAKDVGITAAINADLARDQQLSALRINVDTVDARVTLRGTAPDSASRDRATTLANAVSGVLAVDNQLSVTPGG